MQMVTLWSVLSFSLLLLTVKANTDASEPGIASTSSSWQSFIIGCVVTAVVLVLLLLLIVGLYCCCKRSNVSQSSKSDSLYKKWNVDVDLERRRQLQEASLRNVADLPDSTSERKSLHELAKSKSRSRRKKRRSERKGKSSSRSKSSKSSKSKSSSSSTEKSKRKSKRKRDKI